MGWCFFIGHRNAPEDTEEKVLQAVEFCIQEQGMTHFIVGQYGAFDAMAAKAVRQMKQKYPNITLQLLLPYHPAIKPVTAPPGFDGTYYPFETSVHPRYAMRKANQHMVKSCDCLIAYACHPGNARNLLEYARHRENLQIINLAEAEEYRR